MDSPTDLNYFDPDGKDTDPGYQRSVITRRKEHFANTMKHPENWATYGFDANNSVSRNHMIIRAIKDVCIGITSLKYQVPQGWNSEHFRVPLINACARALTNKPFSELMTTWCDIIEQQTEKDQKSDEAVGEGWAISQPRGLGFGMAEDEGDISDRTGRPWMMQRAFILQPLEGNVGTSAVTSSEEQMTGGSDAEGVTGTMVSEGERRKAASEETNVLDLSPRMIHIYWDPRVRDIHVEASIFGVPQEGQTIKGPDAPHPH